MGPFSHGSAVHTDIMKTQALKQALISISLMLLLVGPGVMKKSHVRKNGFFRFVRLNIAGILKINDPNFGHCITPKRSRVNPFESFHYPIGRSSIFGSTFI